jgi:hypothetical protein
MSVGVLRMYGCPPFERILAEATCNATINPKDPWAKARFKDEHEGTVESTSGTG